MAVIAMPATDGTNGTPGTNRTPGTNEASGAPLEVEIEELVLHGFDPRHGRTIAQAVQDELATALAGWQPSRAGTGTGTGTGLGTGMAGPAGPAGVNAGTARVPYGGAPGPVGRAVATRIAQALRDGDGSRA